MRTLAEDMVLLAFDDEGGRLPVRQSLAPAVRGALLAELLDGGALADRAGTARAAGQAPQDAVLRRLWEQVGAEPDRKWLHWVRKDGRESIREVLRGLEKDGLVEQSTDRVFGVFPLNKAALTADGVAAARGVRAAVAAAAEAAGGADAGRVALLAGIAHAGGQLAAALPADRRRALKDRLAALSADAAPVSAAVQRAVQDLQGAAASA
ncbi:GPP34 family phosphoprotein [Streptomyces sp. 2P-4]|uniref:GOLPH3/VPS74 family protein n=1 Tax=Streptomyces sp. 2P-4 TaxID=2931974 RepID=UPI00253F95A4|nr:GPP34 family phosphoprotein [Streptomyces sp. 2P-4]